MGNHLVVISFGCVEEVEGGGGEKRLTVGPLERARSGLSCEPPLHLSLLNENGFHRTRLVINTRTFGKIIASSAILAGVLHPHFDGGVLHPHLSTLTRGPSSATGENDNDMMDRGKFRSKKAPSCVIKFVDGSVATSSILYLDALRALSCVDLGFHDFPCPYCGQRVSLREDMEQHMQACAVRQGLA